MEHHQKQTSFQTYEGLFRFRPYTKKDLKEGKDKALLLINDNTCHPVLVSELGKNGIRATICFGLARGREYTSSEMGELMEKLFIPQVHAKIPNVDKVSMIDIHPRFHNIIAQKKYWNNPDWKLRYTVEKVYPNKGSEFFVKIASLDIEEMRPPSLIEIITKLREFETPLEAQAWAQENQIAIYAKQKK